MSASYEVRGAVAVITLNNPPVNGLGMDTRKAVAEGVERAEDDPAVRAGVLAMSAATIDRALAPAREKSGERRRLRSAGIPSVRRSIPVRTFSDWDDPAPALSKRTWWCTAARPHVAAICRHWY